MNGKASIEFLREMVDVTIKDPDFQPNLCFLEKQILVDYVSGRLEQEFQGHKRRKKDKSIVGQLFQLIHDNPLYKLEDVDKQFHLWLNRAECCEDEIITYLVENYERMITDAMKKDPKSYKGLIRLWKAIASEKDKSYSEIAYRLGIKDDKLNLLKHRLIYSCFEIYKQNKKV